MPALVYEKMGITSSDHMLVINDPGGIIKAFNLPFTPSTEASSGLYEHVILFSKIQSELDMQFPLYKARMSEKGKLWVAWPKGERLDTDLNIKHVIRIGYNHGLVESTNLRIDEIWTALKFTHPKPGKKYNNSYGTLA